MLTLDKVMLVKSSSSNGGFEQVGIDSLKTFWILKENVLFAGTRLNGGNSCQPRFSLRSISVYYFQSAHLDFFSNFGTLLPWVMIPPTSTPFSRVRRDRKCLK